MKSARFGTLVLLFLLGGWLAAAADTVHLRDGRKIRGKVVSHDEAAIVIETPMGKLRYPSRLVVKVVKEGEETPDKPAPDTPADTGPAVKLPGDPVNLTDEQRQQFGQARGEADKATTAAEGLAVWKDFLKKHPSGQLADAAKPHLAAWQKRVDEKLVRFGPTGWIPRDELQKRNEKVDKLMAEAEKLKELDAAVKLLDEATRENPYRVEAAFTKARRQLQENHTADAAGTYEQVLRVDPEQVPARNNLGVLNARQKVWGRALQHLVKAAGLADNDTVFDNLDLTMDMAYKQGYSAKALSGVDRQLRQIVEKLHAQNKHTGQNRWGNAWISEDEYKKNVEHNRKVSRDLAALKARLDKIEREYKKTQAVYEKLDKEVQQKGDIFASGPVWRKLLSDRREARTRVRDLEREGKDAQNDLEAKRMDYRMPSHASSLVLLDLKSGGSLPGITLPPEPDKDGGGQKGNGPDDDFDVPEDFFD